jgi:hypothetical protein
MGELFFKDDLPSSQGAVAPIFGEADGERQFFHGQGFFKK